MNAIYGVLAQFSNRPSITIDHRFNELELTDKRSNGHQRFENCPSLLLI